MEGEDREQKKGWLRRKGEMKGGKGKREERGEAGEEEGGET